MIWLDRLRYLAFAVAAYAVMGAGGLIEFVLHALGIPHGH